MKTILIRARWKSVANDTQPKDCRVLLDHSALLYIPPKSGEKQGHRDSPCKCMKQMQNDAILHRSNSLQQMVPALQGRSSDCQRDFRRKVRNIRSCSRSSANFQIEAASAMCHVYEGVFCSWTLQLIGQQTTSSLDEPQGLR